MRRKIILSIYILMHSLIANIQLQCQIKSIGLPSIHNYKKSEYKAATQNWSMVQDKNGIMYFANNDGVLEFDGKNWNLYTIPNRSIVRALAIDKNQTIWLGADNEFGYLAVDKQGKHYYQSIINKIPDKYREFGGIWKIYPTKTGIYVQSQTLLFYYDYEKIEIIEGYSDYQFSFYVNNRLFIQKRNKGLHELRGDKLFLINDGSVFRDKVEVWAMIPLSQDSILIATQQQGIFMYDGYHVQKFISPIDNFLITNQIFSVQKLKNDLLAFGTIQSGLLITTLKGNIIQHIDISTGLQNNTILSLFEDKNNGLWLGLDNGIDYVEIKSSFTYLNDGFGVYGTGYTAILFKDYLYLGTNQGLYRKSWSSLQANKDDNKAFSLVENTKGQVWNLEHFDNILLCGHDRGTFQIDGNSAKQISEEKGGWTYIRPKDSRNLLIGGTYSCLTLFNKTTDKNWKFLSRINGLHESSREIVLDTLGNYWMSHGLKGIFRINLTDNYDSVLNLKLYNVKNGLPSSIDNYVYKLGEEIIVCAEKGIYQYNYKLDKFEKSVYFNQLFGENNKIRTPKLDSKSNIWHYKNDHPAVLIKQSKGYKLVESIFKKFDKSAINSFENIEIVNDSNIFFGTDKGFIHFNTNYKDSAFIEFPTLIRSVKLTKPNDSVIFYGKFQNKNDEMQTIINKTAEVKVPYEMNAIKFSFVAPFYSDFDKTQYRYKLQGLDENWSEWQSETEKEYTNLSAGTYNFIVQSKNILGQFSKQVSFKFTILSPWYLSIWAKIAYIVMIIIGFYLMTLYIIFLFDKQKKKLEEEKKQKLIMQKKQFEEEVVKSEKEILRLKQEKLESQIRYKSNELASLALHNSHKNEILMAIKEDLEKLPLNNQDDNTKMIKRIISSIQHEMELDDNWNQFELFFDEVHENFLKRFKEKYPELKPLYLKLCAYIRMKLSSKQIASLMNISLASVEKNRYRLREKLNLGEGIKLTDYIENF